MKGLFKNYNMKIEKFLNLARQQAIIAQLKDKHGAVIVKKNRVLSVGKNIPKTHPKQKHYNNYQNKKHEVMHHYMHAEFSALNQIDDKIDLSDATIYIYKIKKDGSQSLSRPCSGCMKAITERGIKEMVYSTKQGFTKETINIENIVHKKFK